MASAFGGSWKPPPPQKDRLCGEATSRKAREVAHPAGSQVTWVISLNGDGEKAHPGRSSEGVAICIRPDYWHNIFIFNYLPDGCEMLLVGGKAVTLVHKQEWSFTKAIQILMEAIRL